MLVATLAERLGIEPLAGRLVWVRRGQPGAANAGRKVMALILAMAIEHGATLTARVDGCTRRARGRDVVRGTACVAEFLPDTERRSSEMT